MRPRLVSSDAEFPIPAGGLTIGRESFNGVHVADPMASARHCRIEADEGHRFVITDENSTNGTFVNGKPVTRTYLEHGDRIRVGRTTLRFLLEEQDVAGGLQVHLEDRDDDALVSSETIQLNPTDSVYLKTDFAGDQAHLPRLARDMSVLLKLSAEIGDIDDPVRLQEMLLKRVFEVVPADNGAILIASANSQSFLPSPVWRQRHPAADQIRVSRTVTEAVLKSGQSILRNDLLGDKSSTDSLVISHAHSVLCVPLSVRNARVGVLYLNATTLDTRFDHRHLELTTAIATIAAVAFEHLRYVEWLESENQQLAREIELRHDMIGHSPKMQAVYEKIAQVAPNDNRVLILGESGTGKELVARAIHKNSNRRNARFVTVNCGAITESLFMSELFGHVKGAFTGADRDRKGFIEEADGGTLFLDEVGELPAHCQAALLRVIENSEVLRVGSTRSIPVDVRILSATSRVLKDEISASRFRADLFFRLGLPLELPPLRDRLEDIPLLVRFFVQGNKQYAQRDLAPTPPETIRFLQEYSWPGNVRELSLAIQWAVVFGKGDRIRPEDLPPEIQDRKPAMSTPAAVGRLDDAKESYERQLIIKALQETRGNVSEAAALLDRVPTYLQRRISQMGLREELKRIREGR
jgi:transcriptional regulator with GAF, ATPase, and Fis domain